MGRIYRSLQKVLGAQPADGESSAGAIDWRPLAIGGLVGGAIMLFAFALTTGTQWLDDTLTYRAGPTASARGIHLAVGLVPGIVIVGFSLAVWALRRSGRLPRPTLPFGVGLATGAIVVLLLVVAYMGVTTPALP